MSEIEHAVEQAIEARVRRLHVAGPGKVKSYNASARTVDIEPMIVAPIPAGTDEDDGDEEAPLPVLMNVPVQFPRAGGVEITMPVQAGDTMLILFTDWDLGRWRASGEKRRPITSAKHGISGAVAIPGLYPSNAAAASFSVALTGTEAHFNGNSDEVALASYVKAELQKIANMFITFVPGTGGANFPNSYTPSNVGSAILKTGDSSAPSVPEADPPPP